MNEKVKKPFYKRGWFIALCVVFILGAISSLTASPEKELTVAPTSSTTPPPSTIAEESTAPESSAQSADSLQSSQASSQSVTTGQRNALAKAKQYLGTMPFSYEGVIKQLEFEKFSHEDAVYGADNCGADWNDQAAKKAKQYLSNMAFSRDALIQQLEFEGFTNAQAVYGASQNGY